MSGKLSGIAAVLAAVGLNDVKGRRLARGVGQRDQRGAGWKARRPACMKAGLDATKLGRCNAAANARSKAILGHAEAKGREAWRITWLSTPR
jgi:hypothetical protein